MGDRRQTRTAVCSEHDKIYLPQRMHEAVSTANYELQQTVAGKDICETHCRKDQTIHAST